MFFDLKVFGGASALMMQNEVWTYSKLFEISEEIAEMIPPRSLVFLVCSNTPVSIAAYVGFINHGIVPVMVDRDLDEDLFRSLLEQYAPAYIFAEDGRYDFLDHYARVLDMGGYILYDTKVRHPYPLHEELALLMTTSGSTGSPKLVRQSYRNLQSNIDSIISYLHIGTTERAITNLPMHYVYGLSIINTHLYAGASLVVTEKSILQRDFWDLFREEEVTNLGGVPYTYAMLKRLRFFRMELPALRTLTQAGGKLDPELHREFAEFAHTHGKRFVVMYGAAEATARMGYLPAADAIRKTGAMGIAIPSGRFELVDEAGGEIRASDTVGELVYYGANVTLGYAMRGADLARGDERGRRYETGDLARRDADGYYTVVGRKRRFLKLFGKRTNLQEVEHILRQHFGEIEVACAGVDDHLYVFVTQEHLASEIVPFLSAKLGLHHSAFAAKYIASIPKNASGKTVYRELEQYYDV